MTNTLLLQIEPLDTLFFRDARPFDASSRAASGLPKPQTVAGALRTAMLRSAGVDLAAVAAAVRAGESFRDAAAAGGSIGKAIGEVTFRGPWFGQDGEILYPAPATLRRERDNGKFIRLDPIGTDLPGWKPLETGMMPLWYKGRARLNNAPGYLRANDMLRFLDGGLPEKVVPEADLFGFHDRTGIGLDAERAVAADGMIYSVRMLELRRGVRLHVEMEGAEEALDLFAPGGQLVPLGGEGRRAVVTPGPQKTPEVPPASSSDRRLVVLTTPAPMDGWKLRGPKLLSAAVPGYEAVSGWDLARGGPKPNRFSVPAGSVYFLEPGAAPAHTFVDPEDAAVGWGSYLEGTWNHV